MPAGLVTFFTYLLNWIWNSLKEAVSLMLYGHLKLPQHLHKHHNNRPLLSLFPSMSDSENISFSGQTGELLHRLRLHAWQAVCTLQISGTSVCVMSPAVIASLCGRWGQSRTDSEGITCQPADSCHQTEAVLLEEEGGEITCLLPHIYLC